MIDCVMERGLRMSGVFVFAGPGQRRPLVVVPLMWRTLAHLVDDSDGDHASGARKRPAHATPRAAMLAVACAATIAPCQRRSRANRGCLMCGTVSGHVKTLHGPGIPLVGYCVLACGSWLLTWCLACVSGLFWPLGVGHIQPSSPLAAKPVVPAAVPFVIYVVPTFVAAPVRTVVWSCLSDLSWLAWCFVVLPFLLCLRFRRCG